MPEINVLYIVSFLTFWFFCVKTKKRKKNNLLLKIKESNMNREIHNENFYLITQHVK